MNYGYYSENELKEIGIKKYGTNVFISRNSILYHPEQLEIGNNVRIDDFTTISGKVILGNYIHIAQFCGLYGGSMGIFMDDFSGLSSKVTIYATSNDYSGNTMTNPMVPAKYKTTDKNSMVRIGRHVIVADGCAVGAMTLCNKSLDSFKIYGGVPAKMLKERERKLLDLEKQLMEEDG